jgi:sigma54-dependent transcription regulator
MTELLRNGGKERTPVAVGAMRVSRMCSLLTRRCAKVGKIEAAHGGTLFLDEIGEMPADTQLHLLRVLEKGEIEPSPLHMLGERGDRGCRG